MEVRLDLSELEKLEREHPGKVDAMLSKLAHDMEGETKNNGFARVSPSGPPKIGVDTSTLKNSVTARRATSGDGWEVVAGAEADGFDYGLHWEFGTAQTPARPYMLPSFEVTVNNIPRNLLKDTVEK